MSTGEVFSSMFKKLFYTLLIFLILACFGAAGTLYWLIVVEPGEQISLENIRRILGRESPVYYSDGVTPLGVFFADAHRQYVEYEEIPKTFINALIAAEDNRFFSHYGFDFAGITRAAIKNVQARRVIQGGSTLTQQTAKNLFKREGRSFRAKFKELLFALKLEYHYSKEQILEFYVNQFFVSGNGLGLGVAARYYFDKSPDELTLLESAYIAASVKRPNYYNPFIKKTNEAISEAKRRGKSRVTYVLKAMRGLGMINEYEYNAALVADIPFNKGNVGYSLDYVMEMVTDAVSSEQLIEALAVQGIENIATSGIRIVTTVDKELQDKTLYYLRKQLSLLDVRLRGYERDDVQAELRLTEYSGDLVLEENAFLFGVIQSIKKDNAQVEIVVDFGRQSGTGLIDRDGLTDMINARVKWQKNRWSEASEEDLTNLLTQIEEGDRVWVSVRKMNPEQIPLLDLERFPQVKGGAIVMQNGQILSVAGGIENRFFNRAVYGKRTMGSSYKPFVYSAALQLGWNTGDILSNKRDVFVYQNQPYFPRPDHKIDHEKVSMSWAGVRSENVASVWLAAHLCDHLSRSRLADMAAHLDLAPRVVDGEQEPYRLFRSRIRDRYGIVIDQDVLRKAAYRKTIQHIEEDLIFEGLNAEYEALKNLHYGLGFKDFLVRAERELIDNKNLRQSRKDELQLRKKLLSHSYLALSKLRRQLNHFLEDEIISFSSFGVATDVHEDERPGLYHNNVTGKLIFDFPSALPAGSVAVDRQRVQRYLAGIESSQKKMFIEAIRLADSLSVQAYDFVSFHVEQDFKQMRDLLPYSMEVLEYIDDYRILLGLKYLVAFGKSLGIESPLEPVLSFPLGSNSVTLLETTRVYEALVTGKTTLFREKNNEINNTLAIIDRIESEDGFVLYRPEQETREIIAPEIALAIGHILENTVKFGTGRYADKHVKLTGEDTADEMIDELAISVPLLGKTGTANLYTNASFFGYLPALNSAGNGMTIDGGYAVGVYVGYDDNKEMRQKTTRVTGAVGALPAWTDIINAILKEKEYVTGIDPVDLSFYGLGLNRLPIGQVNLEVAENEGGVFVSPIRKVDPLDRYHPSIMTFGDEEQEKLFDLSRMYAPFWQNHDNVQ